MTALLGINALRRGEQDNCIACVGPSSCIFPIAPEAVHTRPSGSREAVEWFTDYLDEWPGDLRVRWLLNIAEMTLGEYPDKVPPRYLIPVEPFRSKLDLGRFENVATRVGLIARGPDLAGGCIFDDFTGDGRPDVFTTTFDVDHGASLYVNRGDGTFEDRSAAAGLDDQVYALNVTRADYDNDGQLDVLLLRGAWEKPARMSLLRNKGGGVFEDVTVASGLGEPIATESAAWGDYDNDGRLDLFVCGEYRLRPDPNRAIPSSQRPDPRNRCRLYHNQGDGTFVDVAAAAGVQNERWAKGSAWGDYDNDGRLDLFVSNMDGPARLYHNRGDGTFVDVAPDAGDRRAAARLHLHVLGLRQRRPARHLRRRLEQQPRRGRGRLPRPAGPLGRPRPPLPQPRPGRIPRGQPRGRPRAADARDVGQRRRHRQRRRPRPPPRHRLDEPVGPGPRPDVRQRRRPVRGRDRVDRHRPPPEGARRLVRRLGRRRRPRPLRRPRRRLPRRSRLQRPVPEPRPRAALAQGQARRHQDQPLGDRRQAPGRPGGRPTAPARSTA